MPLMLPQHADRLEAAGLQPVAAVLARAARPSIRLRPSRPADERDVPVGASKLGGHPDLGPALYWPSAGGSPLCFVAQVNLAEVHPFDAGELLPAEGLLSFFYDAVHQPWGYDRLHRASWAVLYEPLGARLARQFPDAGAVVAGFPCLRLRPEPEMTSVPWESADMAALALTHDQREAYADLLEPDDSVAHRLLGHPDPIQGDMQSECHEVWQATVIARSWGHSVVPTDWRLLLQIDSEPEAHMTWGDAGRLYYWIPRQALAQRDWDQVWVQLQCC